MVIIKKHAGTLGNALSDFDMILGYERNCGYYAIQAGRLDPHHRRGNPEQSIANGAFHELREETGDTYDEHNMSPYVINQLPFIRFNGN